MTLTKARNSTIEVYRILAMVAIVSYHYGVHGGVLGSGDLDTAGAERFLVGYSSMGKWGVDVFVLIGAYFMAQASVKDGTIFRWKGLRSILIQVWSTSWIILAAALLWMPERVDAESTWRAIFPVATDFYWFVTIYVMLMVLSPFINILVKAMTRRQHATLMGILFVAWGALSLIPGVTLGANSMTWFVELYLIAAFVAKYPIRGNAKAWGASAVVLAVAVPMSALVAFDVAAAHPDLGFDPALVRAQYAPFVALSAVFGLIAVTKLRPRHSPAINSIAAATFGVYLITDNAILRPLLWEDWVGTKAAALSPEWLPLHAIAFTVIVYVAATLIELVRERLIQRPLVRVGNRVFASRTPDGTSHGTARGSKQGASHG